MSNSISNDTMSANDIFSDPVAYLAGLGIDAALVSETRIPAAA